MAIAFDSTLSQSPFYDPDAARKSYRTLSKDLPENGELDPQVLLALDALANFVALYDRVDTLERENKRLQGELAKRKEALKRLREVTLGRPEVEQ